MQNKSHLKPILVVGGSIVLGAIIIAVVFLLKSDQVNYGSNDGLTVQENEVTQKISTSTKKFESNDTAALSRDMMASYLKAKEVQGEINTEEREQLAKTSLQNLEEYREKSINEITSDDITVVEANNENRVRYGNKLGRLLAENTPEKMPNELQVVIDATENDDLSQLERLDPIINGFTELRNKYQELQVPDDVVGLHVILINTLNAHIRNLSDIQEMGTDAVSALYGLREHRPTAERLGTVISLIKIYFDETDTTFSDDDPAQNILIVSF